MLTALYRVIRLEGGRDPDLLITVITPGLDPLLHSSYEEYVQDTNSNPQVGDVVVVRMLIPRTDKQYTILGLHAEPVDAN